RDVITKELSPGMMHTLGMHHDCGLHGVQQAETEPDGTNPEPTRARACTGVHGEILDPGKLLGNGNAASSRNGAAAGLAGEGAWTHTANMLTTAKVAFL